MTTQPEALRLADEIRADYCRCHDAYINRGITDPQCESCNTEDLRHRAAAEIERLTAELERERMRLAGCGVAALGYFDGCLDEYKSASLDDVLQLYAKYKEATARVAELEADAARNKT